MFHLVLVFFDARHPEPGAMRDTLEHLVKTNIGRHDSDKILYILNQIDTAAREDNPEDIIGSCQRGLAQEGLVGGSFYAIYNEDQANVIEDKTLASRYKRKKDIDLKEITDRMHKISTERAYRIAHSAQEIAEKIENEQIPALKNHIRSWRRKVVFSEIVIFGSMIAFSVWLYLTYSAMVKIVQEWLMASIINGAIAGGVALLFVFIVHYILRKKIAKRDAKKIARHDPVLANALLHNNRFWHGMFSTNSRGWGNRTAKKLASIKETSKRSIQKLTDQFADPSGQINEVK